jgi:hypothetical protein
MKKIIDLIKKLALALVALVLIGAIFGRGGKESSSSSSSESEAAVEQQAQEETKEEASAEAEAEESESEPEEPIEYQDVTVDELTAALDENPLKAKQTYQDAHIRLTGVLNNIDSSGSYFNLNNGDQYSFDSVYCSILDDATLDRIASSSIGDTLVVCGTVTDVGEVLGYYVDVDYIE